MWDLIKSWISPANITSVVRAALMALAGGLVTSGQLDPTQFETLIGSVSAIVAIAWSYFVHKPKPALPLPPPAVPAPQTETKV